MASQTGQQCQCGVTLRRFWLQWERDEKTSVMIPLLSEQPRDGAADEFMAAMPQDVIDATSERWRPWHDVHQETPTAQQWPGICRGR